MEKKPEDFYKALQDALSANTNVGEQLQEPKVEQQPQEPKVEQQQQEPKVEAGRTFTAEEVERIVASRLSRVKNEAIEKKAAEVASHALKAAEETRSQLEDMIRRNQILELSASKGIDKDLLEESGLSGEKLVSFADKLATVLPKDSKSLLEDKINSNFNNMKNKPLTSAEWAEDITKKIFGAR